MSLIEVLIAVVLLGIGGVATLSALGASIRGSSTFETKIAGLAVIETAASGLTEQVEPCTADSYETAARAALPLTGWGSSAFGSPENLTASVVCEPSFHVVTLTYTAPNGRGSSVLQLTLGGPTVAMNTPGGGGGVSEPSSGNTSCQVASLNANVQSMELWSDSTLDEDVTVSVGLAGTCGTVRARLSPEDDGNFIYLEPNAAGVFVVTGRQQVWTEGPAEAQFEHLLNSWTPMNSGDVFFLFDVGCILTDVSVDPTSVELNGDQLAANIAVSATASGACPGLRWRVATGVEGAIVSDAMTVSEGTITGTIPSTSAPWAVGGHTVDIIDSHERVIGSTELAVTEAEVEVTG